MDDLIEETIDIPQDFQKFPVFAYDPEKPIKQDPFMQELNQKLEVIVNSEQTEKIEPRKKSYFEKFEEELSKPNKKEAEHHGNPVIALLFDIVQDALTDFRLLHTPNFSGFNQDDRPTKVRMRHFLKGRRGMKCGVENYSMRIGQCLDGLVRYAKYDKNFFGEDNQNLKTAQQNYKTLNEKIKNEKDVYLRAEYLHGMIIAVEILFEKEIEVVSAEEITPLVSSGVSDGGDEFAMDSENY